MEVLTFTRFGGLRKMVRCGAVVAQQVFLAVKMVRCGAVGLVRGK